MKTIITIEDNKVTIQTDDGSEVQAIKVTIPEVPKDTVQRQPPPPVAPEPKLVQANEPKQADCGYCRRRGSPCVRHGGTYGTAIAHTPKTKVDENVEWCKFCEADTTHTGFNCPNAPGWTPKPTVPGTPAYAQASRTQSEQNRRKPGRPRADQPPDELAPKHRGEEEWCLTCKDFTDHDESFHA